MTWQDKLFSPFGTWWQVVTDTWHEKTPPGAKRSPKWRKTRAEHLKKHPRCECCGGSASVEVHHVEPFHICPERELDPENLMSLCSAGKYGINCHQLVGHLGTWRRWNPAARIDAKYWRLKFAGQFTELGRAIHAFLMKDDA